MQTIQATLDKTEGIGQGFDVLRVALAMMVLLNHSFIIVNGNYDYSAHGSWALFGLIVPMFFALSGFLISSSASRLAPHNFLLNRAMRIVPALAVDILVSAIIIGPLVTAFSMRAYLADKAFAYYFLNLIGFIHYLLPGVFLSNPHAGQVNGSLWTVPFEIGCYLITLLMMASGAMKSSRRICFSAAALGIAISIAIMNASDGWLTTPSDSSLQHYLSNFLGRRGAFLYLYFLAGVLMYGLKDELPFSGLLAAACVVLLAVCRTELVSAGAFTDVVLAFPTAYIVVFFGLIKIGKLPVYSNGDYSYGIYLYGCPLQQTLVFLWPNYFSVGTHFACSVVLATVVAMLSWHLIEKPTLKLRRKFSFTARKGERPHST